jgi:hypothetical protein
MQEAAFYHPKSETALIADLIQHFPEDHAQGFMGALLKLNGLVGPKGSTPRDLRFTFLAGKEEARLARDVIVNDWKPKQMIIDHGNCVGEGTATQVISKALGPGMAQQIS